MQNSPISVTRKLYNTRLRSSTLCTKSEGKKEVRQLFFQHSTGQGDLPERMRHVTQTYEQHEGGEGVSDRFSHDFMTAE